MTDPSKAIEKGHADAKALSDSAMDAAREQAARSGRSVAVELQRGRAGELMKLAHRTGEVAYDRGIVAQKLADNRASQLSREQLAKRSRAETRLDLLAKQRSNETGTSYAKAYDEVLKTKEGAALYAETVTR